jgi:hypothetical protein
VKKLSLFISFATSITQANTHDRLVNAIIESDYETFITTYSKAIVSQKEQANLFDIADQIIPFRQRWIVEHAYQPQLDKDLVIAATYAFLTAIGVGFFGISAKLIERSKNPTIPIILGSMIILPASYFCIEKLIKAFQKPKILLANAMRIKDFLMNT